MYTDMSIECIDIFFSKKNSPVMMISELIVFDQIAHAMEREKQVNLDRLADFVVDLEIDQQVKSKEYLTTLVHRLDQLRVIYTKTSDDGELVIEGIQDNSSEGKLVRMLKKAFMSSNTLADFKERVFTCELNRYFIDDVEVEKIYKQLLKELGGLANSRKKKVGHDIPARFYGEF